MNVEEPLRFGQTPEETERYLEAMKQELEQMKEWAEQHPKEAEKEWAEFIHKVLKEYFENLYRQPLE